MQTLKRTGLLALTLGAISLTALAADLGAGIQAFNDKKYDQAEATLRDAVKAEPDNVDANFYLGRTLIERGKPKDAAPFLEKAGKEKPEAEVELARAYALSNRLDDASKTLDSVQESQAENSDLHLTRGMILAKREKWAEAATQLDKAIELDGNNADAHYYMGVAQSRLKRTDLMVKHFEMFLQLAPNSPEAPKIRSLLRSL